MAFQPTPADVTVIITTPSSGPNAGPHFQNERRITPTWTVVQLKSKLETMTGIPPGCQRLQLKLPGLPARWIDGDESVIGDWSLVRGCEIEVRRLSPRPSGYFCPWFSFPYPTVLQPGVPACIIERNMHTDI